MEAEQDELRGIGREAFRDGRQFLAAGNLEDGLHLHASGKQQQVVGTAKGGAAGGGKQEGLAWHLALLRRCV